MKVLKNIGIFLLLILFLTPGIHRVLHEHNPQNIKIKSSPDHTGYDEKCLVCDYAISLFSKDADIVLPDRFDYPEQDNLVYSSEFFPKQNLLTISLRAPPAA